MPETYQPRKLPRNHDYPGYQFYCFLQKNEDSAEGCFCYAVLSVIDWLKERLRETKVIPPEMARLPDREKSREIAPSDLASFTINSGFSAYVVSLPAHGIWTLRLKEPDSKTDRREVVPGRFFATNVGIHILNDGLVELGIRIDVTDPEDAPEVEFAFRPKFVRYLHQSPNIILSQVSVLPYNKSLDTESDEEMKSLRSVLDSSESTMPLILVTQGIRLPKVEPASLFPAISPFRAEAPSTLFPLTMPAIDRYYPFDADDIASHNFGYAITFRIPESRHEALSRILKKTYMPGDILFAEPKRFGGNVCVISRDDAGAVDQVWHRAHGYSRNRKYSFGNVKYEFDARNIENKELINRIRASGDMAAEEKLAKMNRKIDELQEENEIRVRKISELREQLLSEFSRGEEAERLRTEGLFEEHGKLEEELRSIKARNLHLEQENREARAILSSVRMIRDMAEMPRSNEDVVNYFKNVFGNRIVFTERGRRMACRCDIRPDGLWYYLYQMATILFDLHHAGNMDVEKDFLNVTGIEVAMTEGSQTNKDGKLKRQRLDFYEGKEIYVFPHLKLETKRTGIVPERRIHYYYDREMDVIIIGWVGEHMETAGTMHMS